MSNEGGTLLKETNKPLMGIGLTLDRFPPSMSQTRYALPCTNCTLLLNKVNVRVCTSNTNQQIA